MSRAVSTAAGVCVLLASASVPCSADADRLERTVVELSTHGSRMAGYPGDRHAAEYIEAQFRAAGVQDVRREPFEVAVPIDKGASLELMADGTRVQLWCLWPNLVRTSTLPPEGVEAELIYGGHGRFRDLDGKDVADRVVLMEFNSGTNWHNPASLGARAVIFVEPDETTLEEARRKWSRAALGMPRFWIDRAAADELKGRLERGMVHVRVTARMDWEKHTSWNIWGRVPGMDPKLRDELVAVEAYYDGMSVVPALNPAAESTASIAALIEFAHSLKDHPPGRSVVLLATGAHFVRKAGITGFLNRYARRDPFFKSRIPRRLSARSDEALEIARQLAERGLGADSLGIQFSRDPLTDALELAAVDLQQLSYQLARKGLTPASIGIVTEPDSLDISLFIGLDLSTHSDRLAIWNSSEALLFQRFFVPIGRSFMRYSVAHRAEMETTSPLTATLINGISPAKGRDIQSYLSGGEAVSDAGVARLAGIMSVALRTVEDPRLRLDTPLDRAESVDLQMLRAQSDLVTGVLRAALSDADLYGHNAAELRAGHDKNILDLLVSVRGALRMMAPRGINPDDPVPFGIACLAPDFDNTWRPWVYLADEHGNYTMPGILPFSGVEIHGFRLDRQSGDVTHATDRGERAQKFGLIEQSLSKDETAWTTVLFPVFASDIYDRVAADRFFTKGDWDTQILGRTGSAPSSFGYSMGGFSDDVMVLYGAHDDSLRIADGSMMLLGNEGTAADEEALGVGFSPESNRLLAQATLNSARDMWRLDESRLQRLRAFSIENPRVERLHETARRLIVKAEEAQRARQWSLYVRYAREALGMEYRAYPDVRGTQNDVMSGLVFFVAILIPASFFLEKLIFASTDVNRQLVLLGLVFLANWVILSQVHPAFDLANPLVILLALLIGVTGFFVITLLAGRFNAFMLAHRQRRAGTDVSEMSRSGALYAAFALGISNMRRRVLRTALTLTTITLLTFTVLSFTSFIPSIRTFSTPLDWKPPYPGMLLQDTNWWDWDDPTIDYVRSHFETAGTVVSRRWRFNHWWKEGDIRASSGPSTAAANAVLGLDRDEPAVTGIDRCLISGSWFEDNSESTVILSETLAEELGIQAELPPGGADPVSIGFFGRQWRVRGVFDAEAFEDIRDLNDEPLTPVQEEFNDLMTPGMEILRQKGDVFFDLDIGIQFGHIPANRLLIVPHDRLEAIGADNYTIAVRFDDGVDGEEYIQRFLTRSGYRVFTGLPDESGGELKAAMITSLGTTSVEGLGALVIPAIIAALIVLNTMMGSVYERFREIGVYSSVGLAPAHISFLFLAEACVYAVLGVTFGYLIGQAVAKVLLGLDLLGGVSLNYSSTAAVFSAVIVIVVVLLSAIYPAMTASRLAVPDVARRWQIPQPDGDVWRFVFPFTVDGAAARSLCGYLYALFSAYSDESVGNLYTERTRIVSRTQNGHTVHSVQLGMWLAPFDLGVSEYLEIAMYPSGTRGIHEVEVYIERLSGPLAHWQRLNQGFVVQLRHQFLMWQTLGDDLRDEHDQAARRLVVVVEET